MDEKNSSKQTSQGAVACGFENLKITVLEITYRPIVRKDQNVYLALSFSKITEEAGYPTEKKNWLPSQK